MNRLGIELAQEFEGLSLVPYYCPANVATTGYGSTYYRDGTRVKITDDPITQGEAYGMLFHEMEVAEMAVIRATKVYLNGNQRAALASFVYNLGAGAFRASTLRRRINSGDFDDVEYQLSRWVNAGGKRLNGLVRRRKAEADLFNNTGVMHEK